MVLKMDIILNGEKVLSTKRFIVTGGVGRDTLAKFFSEFGNFTADGLISAQQPVIRHGVKLRNTRRHVLIILTEKNTSNNRDEL